jgi:hypothetical protein
MDVVSPMEGGMVSDGSPEKTTSGGVRYSFRESTVERGARREPGRKASEID